MNRIKNKSSEITSQKFQEQFEDGINGNKKGMKKDKKFEECRIKENPLLVPPYEGST